MIPRTRDHGATAQAPPTSEDATAAGEQKIESADATQKRLPAAARWKAGQPKPAAKKVATAADEAATAKRQSNGMESAAQAPSTIGKASKSAVSSISEAIAQNGKLLPSLARSFRLFLFYRQIVSFASGNH